MELQTVAKPYAKALNALATQNNSFIGWQEYLKALTSVVENEQMKQFVNSPNISLDKKKTFVNTLLEKLLSRKLTKQELNFVDLLVTNNRLIASVYILELFNNFGVNAVRTIEVISAYKLSKEEEKSLMSFLAKKFDCEIILNIVIDSSLLSGLVIKDGDKVIDLSIHARIEELSACLSIN
ncbi:ATP synthase delta chain [hydrothermal vent metagenome]|uniref:ATP synthase delta chain n=1 Tax=hydrothermal vent metagenome TaxID=652676 RepID=A0A1W1CVZ2_9ZZZZ